MKDLSLLVIATHSPPDIPNASGIQRVPMFCMSKPLSLDDSSGSVRPVNIGKDEMSLTAPIYAPGTAVGKSTLPQ